MHAWSVRCYIIWEYVLSDSCNDSQIIWCFCCAVDYIDVLVVKPLWPRGLRNSDTITYCNVTKEQATQQSHLNWSTSYIYDLVCYFKNCHPCIILAISFLVSFGVVQYSYRVALGKKFPIHINSYTFSLKDAYYLAFFCRSVRYLRRYVRRR